MNKVRALLAAALLAVVGCAHQVPAATAPAVRIGECYAKMTGRPVSCAQAHVAETVFVGTGSATDVGTAMSQCRRAQARFLGQDFNTRLSVKLWTANDKSRYRCDVVLRNSTRASVEFQAVTGSLQGVLQRGAAVNLQACLAAPYNPKRDQPYVSCKRRHVAQELFVAPAIGTLNEAYPADVGQRAASACHATASAAKMLGRVRTVTAFYPNGDRAWASGDRTADCWVSTTSGTLPGARGSPR